MDTPLWIEENKLQIMVGVVGVSLIGFGIWQTLHEQMQADSVVQVELQTPQPIASPIHKIIIDVSGAVEKPGVYSFDAGSRVNEALIAAGGLAANANRDYISRNINLAELLVDGTKLYIPHKDDPFVNVSNPSGGGEAAATTVRINSATLQQLEQLWGVGAARAQQIVEHRPYSAVSELVTKAQIPQNVLDRNMGKIQL